MESFGVYFMCIWTWLKLIVYSELPYVHTLKHTSLTSAHWVVNLGCAFMFSFASTFFHFFRGLQLLGHTFMCMCGLPFFFPHIFWISYQIIILDFWKGNWPVNSFENTVFNCVFLAFNFLNYCVITSSFICLGQGKRESVLPVWILNFKYIFFHLMIFWQRFWMFLFSCNLCCINVVVAVICIVITSW